MSFHLAEELSLVSAPHHVSSLMDGFSVVRTENIDQLDEFWPNIFELKLGDGALK